METNKSLVVAAVALCAAAGQLHAQRVVAVRPDAVTGTDVGSELPAQESFLQSMLKLVDEPMELHLVPGVYNLLPSSVTVDSISFSAGLVVSADGVKLVGDSSNAVVLVAHAAYGVFFDNCVGCGISGVTIRVAPAEGEAGYALASVGDRVAVRDCIAYGASPDSTARICEVPGAPLRE